ncbi:MAG: porphobilinogen synthase [Candidatus Alcyoniella australis]|nr:porphobilinogen synthase [Candidatus Alcyoniella australis]
MPFPVERLRRLRISENIRRMVRQTRISCDNLVMPLFVRPGRGISEPIGAMPGCFRMSVDLIAAECEKIQSLDIPAVILFGIPESKDDNGSGAWDDNGIVQSAVRAIKKAVPYLTVITDVCLCEYTSHGHCGVIEQNAVDNDATLPLLARTALSHADAGADIVAPSDMMDGRVGVIREALDDAGFVDKAIMAYSAKYCSSFYGPFREAADSAPAFGDRRSYQMDPANLDEAIREISLDIDEGADIVMVKPALPYLDVIRRAADEFELPIAAYNVSGEFAMIKAAAERGWLDGERAMMESLISIRRAGAQIILTYFAMEAAALIRGGR